MNFVAMTVLLVWLAWPVVAHPQIRLAPVSVEYTGDDSPAASVVFSLKEALRDARSFLYVDGDLISARIVVRMVS
jgi:hypothetical protein